MQLAKPIGSTYKMNDSILPNCQKAKTARKQNAIYRVLEGAFYSNNINIKITSPAKTIFDRIPSP